MTKKLWETWCSDWSKHDRSDWVSLCFELFHRLAHWNKVAVLWAIYRRRPLALAPPPSSRPRTRPSGAAGGSRCRLCARAGRTAWTTGPAAPGAPAPAHGPARRRVWRTEDGCRTGRTSVSCCHGDRKRTADPPLTWERHFLLITDF